MKNLKLLFFLFSLFCVSNLISAQNPCKPNKKFQHILEKSKVFKNQFYSFNPTFSSQVTYVKEYGKHSFLNYRICDLKIEKDTLHLEGFFKTKRNLFHENYFFQAGNRVDTTYIEKIYTLGLKLEAGPYKAFYLDNLNYQYLDVKEEDILPKKLNFQIKLPLQNKHLFIISNSYFIADIFDLNALRKNLQGSDK
jgi:hypothetical protein